jgi:uncharacterized delta-60 repeat protein
MKSVLIALSAVFLVPVANAQAIDTSFASGGQFTLELGGASSTSSQILRQSDGKIVSVAVTPATEGTVATRDIVVTRLTELGQLDPTFGANGIAVIDLAGKEDRASRIVQQSDGKLLITGSTDVNTDFGFANFDGVVVRINQDGSLDRSFNGSGFLTVRLAQDGQDDHCSALALRSDGTIFTTCAQFGFTSLFVVRIKPNGTMDVDSGYAFQTGGIANASLPLAITEPADIVFNQITGAVTIAGTYRSAVDSTLPSRLYLYRLTGTGIQDDNFGLPFLQFGGSSTPYRATGLLGDSQGRLIVAGLQADLSAATLVPVPLVARLTPNGSPDETFGNAGRVDIAGAVRFAATTAIALQSDERLIVGGSASRSPEGTGALDPFVFRVASNGMLDSAFAEGAGVVSINDNTSINRTASSIALGSAGKIILGGVQSMGAPDTQRAFVAQIAPSRVSFAMDSVSVSESAGSAQLTITRSGGTGAAASIRVQTGNISGLAGQDFRALDQMVTFNPGEISKMVSIALISDSLDEADETFSVTLTSSSESLLVDGGSATVVILDDDTAQSAQPTTRRRGGGGGAMGLDILGLLVLLAVASNRRLRN